MSDYNNVEEALDAVLLNEITELESTDSGTDEYADTVNAISALYKARNEQQRIEADYAIAQENQAIERDKIKADSKNKANQTKTDMLGHVVKAAGTVLAIGANTAWILWTMASEKEGNIPGLTQASKFLTKLKIL